MTTAEHEITEGCAPVHCWVHDADEEGAGAYRICLECNHVYPDGQALVDAYNAGAAGVNRNPPGLVPPAMPGWESPGPLPEITDPGQAWSCPLCMHDF